MDLSKKVKQLKNILEKLNVKISLDVEVEGKSKSFDLVISSVSLDAFTDQVYLFLEESGGEIKEVVERDNKLKSFLKELGIDEKDYKYLKEENRKLRIKSHDFENPGKKCPIGYGGVFPTGNDG